MVKDYMNNQNENKNQIIDNTNNVECEEKIEKYYCVYKHTNCINDKCYIGITSLNVKDRWRKNGKAYIRKDKQGKYEHPKFARAIEKYGWDNFNHEIIEEGFFIKDEIEQREIYWISYYDSFKNGYNTTAGGNISLWHLTDVGKATYSKITKGLWQDQQYIQKNTSPVKCIENGFVFKSANEVAKLLHIDAGGIRACCRGDQKTAAGYHWELSNWNEYNLFCEQNPHYLKIFWMKTQLDNNYKELSTMSKNIKPIDLKPVLCIDKDIAYRGQVVANEITGIDRSGIGLCCLGKQNFCGGYQWKFITVEEYAEYIKMKRADIPIPLITQPQNAIPVLCVETNIKYESYKDAYRKTGISHISECCNGKLKTAGGYHWKRIEETKDS